MVTYSKVSAPLLESVRLPALSTGLPPIDESVASKLLNGIDLDARRHAIAALRSRMARSGTRVCPVSLCFVRPAGLVSMRESHGARKS